MGNYFHSYTLDEINKALEIQKDVAKTLDIPVLDLKPCIASLIAGGVQDGEREIAAFIIATELRRMGFSEENALERLIEWNNKLGKRLPMSALRGRIKSAFTKGYEGTKVKGGYKSYGCNGILAHYCKTGKDSCGYYNAHFKNIQSRQKGLGTGSPTFTQLGWWRVLSGVEFKVYCAICEIEDRRSIPAGSPLFASFRQIASVANVSIPMVNNALIQLHFHGLLHYKKGQVHKHYHKASEVKRVIPIPRVNQVKEEYPDCIEEEEIQED